MKTEFFCVSKAKYSGSFAEVKPLGLLLMFISQTQESPSTELLFYYYTFICWLLLAGKTSTGGMATAVVKSTSVKNSPEV